MKSPPARFYRNRRNKKWLGVCSGLADYLGWDVTLVRVVTAVSTVFAGGWPLVVYLATAWFAPTEDEDTAPAQLAQPPRSPALTDQRSGLDSQLQDLDKRLADIEMMYLDSNRRLADEIEKLR